MGYAWIYCSAMLGYAESERPPCALLSIPPEFEIPLCTSPLLTAEHSIYAWIYYSAMLACAESDKPSCALLPIHQEYETHKVLQLL